MEIEENRNFVSTKKKRLDTRNRKIEFHWSVEKINQLIEEVQRCESLWNKNNNMYKDQKLRSRNWKTVGEALDIDMEQCKVKWNSLRTAYNVNIKIPFIRVTSSLISLLYFRLN